MRKLWFCAALFLLLSMLTAPMAAASDAAGPAVTVSSAAGVRGETVTVEVTLTGGAASGNFNLIYDPETVTLTGAALGKGITGRVNTAYGENKARVSFVRMDGAAAYTVCTFSFTITGATPTEGTPLKLDSLRLYNIDGNPVTGTSADGSVSRKAAKLTIATVDATERQSVRVELSVGGTIQPTGGNFTVSYDPATLKPTGVLGLAGFSDQFFTQNLDQSGALRVSFAGTEPIPAGKLCAVVFQAVGSAGESSELTLSDAAFYDENSAPMDVELENGSVTIALPGEDSAKLWMVGGTIEEGGTAAVQLLLQGQGKVYGGQFGLTFDPSMDCEVTCSEACVINQKAGSVDVSFASEAVYTADTPLLTLRFTNAAAGSRVEFADSSVTLYDEDSNAINVVYLRPCELSEEAAVTATIEEEDIQVRIPDEPGEETQVSVTADLADMRFFTEDTVQTVTVILALYENGRFVGFETAEAELSENGVAQVHLSASTAEKFTEFAVFFVDGTSYGPLCDSTKVVIDN